MSGRGSNGEGASVMRQNRQGGFTLIEMMIVIVVIAILLGVLLPQFRGTQDEAAIQRARSELAPDHRLARSSANRYMQDREAMKTATYSGMGHGFQAHDAFATTSQGAIQDRTKEHLVSSDRAIVAARKLMEKAIRDIQEGREPPHVIRDPGQNRFPHLLVVSDLIPGAADWKDYTKNLEAEARARQ